MSVYSDAPLLVTVLAGPKGVTLSGEACTHSAADYDLSESLTRHPGHGAGRIAEFGEQTKSIR